MSQILIIATGGSLGALARFFLSSWLITRFEHLSLSGPLATLSVNVIGSLLMGIAYVFIAEKMQLSPEWRQFVMIGFLAAFTTFSSFSLDTLVLFESGNILAAIAYIMASVLLCIAACWLAIMLTRLI